MMEPTNTIRQNARGKAASILAQWLKRDVYLERLIPPDVADRAFIYETTYGVVRHKSELEWLIRALSPQTPDDDAVPYLFVGLYQIFMLDSVEEYAIVNETVDAVKQAGMNHYAGFVNAILREALRKKESLISRLERQPPHIRYSHPQIMVKRWAARHGEDKAVALCIWNNSRPAVTIRVRRDKSSVPDMMSKLQAAGIDAKTCEIMPDDCIELRHGVRITDLPGFNEGLFMIQDPSTLAPVLLLNPQPGEDILDACAAPGGKTIHIAEKMNDKGTITALDIDWRRLRAVKDNIERSGFRNIKLFEADARDKTAMLRHKFDGILVDAPCTNTGVMRRRPEARWRFSENSLSESAAVQRDLLESCSAAVKPGGRIVFSTCSLEPEEGETLVERWANSHKDFTLEESRFIMPPGSDGGFSARLRRRK